MYREMIIYINRSHFAFNMKPHESIDYSFVTAIPVHFSLTLLQIVVLLVLYLVLNDMVNRRSLID
jgi:hypothetical protein